MSYWKNKVAVITGGSAGLGLAIASVLANKGARLVLVARGADALQEAANRLAEKSGAEVLAVPTDITDQAQVDQLFQQTIERFDRIDALFNCAGRSTRGEMKNTTAEEFAEAMELNFLGLVRCTHAALPSLLKSRGHVVNIGSLAAKSASTFLGAYPPSKFAVAAYSQQLRLELEPQGLKVLLVCPGPIARSDAGSRYDKEASDLPPEAAKPGGGVKLSGIDPMLLAKRIVSYAERGRSELVSPARSRLLFAAAQLSPKLGDWIVRKMT